MAGLRDEITRTFLRLRGGQEHLSPGVALGSAFAAGTVLGNYRILRFLGGGGMGHVYLAIDTRLGRHVALKFLPAEYTSDPTFVHRFQLEAKTASALNHPNILTIYDFAEISGHHVLVSEFVDGFTLQKLLQRNALDQNTGLEIVAQVASALTAAHAAQVIHRDLKPANIMIRPDGYIKIIDFGLAKLLERSPRRPAAEPMLTRPGAVLGTIGYLSPEQARAEDLDARTDIWSLGVILYEVLTRQLPFGGNSDSHVLVSILDDAPRPIPENLKLSPAVTRILDCALQKDRKKRYQNAQQMLADLQKVQGGPITSRGARSFVLKRRSAGLWLWGPVAGALVIAFCLWWWPLNGRWKVLSPDWFELGTPQRVTFAGDVNQAAISPDGKQLAYVTGEPDSETLHLSNLSAHSERQLPGAFDTYRGLTFSPDSKTLYYVLTNQQQERGRLFESTVAEFASAPPAMLLEDLDGPLALSPDGAQFAFFRGRAEGDRSIEQVLLGNEANFRNLKTVLSLIDTQIRPELAWSPRKDWLAAVTYPRRLHQPTRPVVELLTPAGNIAHTYVPDNLRRIWGPVVLAGGKLILFSGVPQNAEQSHLVQLSIPAHQFHEVPSDILGFENLSATTDGQTLASLRVDRRSSIWLANADNLNAPVKLTPDSESLSSLTWSDDGDLIFPSLRSGNVNLVRLNPRDLSVRAVAQPEPYVEHQPAFAPGRDLVVYASNRALGGDDFNLWGVNARTGLSRRLTSGSNYDEEPNISSDGAFVFYTSWAASLRYIWKVPLGGGPPVQISHAQAWHPAISPDGAKVACFLKEGSPGIEAALLSANDGTVLQRLPGIPADSQIRWSPDGTALDFVSNNKQLNGIMRQPLAGGRAQPLIRLAEGKVSAFSWSRDGKQLAYIRSREQRDVFLFPRNHSH